MASQAVVHFSLRTQCDTWRKLRDYVVIWLAKTVARRFNGRRAAVRCSGCQPNVAVASTAVRLISRVAKESRNTTVSTALVDALRLHKRRHLMSAGAGARGGKGTLMSVRDGSAEGAAELSLALETAEVTDRRRFETATAASTPRNYHPLHLLAALPDPGKLDADEREPLPRKPNCHSSASTIDDRQRDDPARRAAALAAWGGLAGSQGTRSPCSGPLQPILRPCAPPDDMRTISNLPAECLGGVGGGPHRPRRAATPEPACQPCPSDPRRAVKLVATHEIVIVPRSSGVLRVLSVLTVSSR